MIFNYIMMISRDKTQSETYLVLMEIDYSAQSVPRRASKLSQNLQQTVWLVVTADWQCPILLAVQSWSNQVWSIWCTEKLTSIKREKLAQYEETWQQKQDKYTGNFGKIWRNFILILLKMYWRGREEILFTFCSTSLLFISL